jgi:signal transduction histidine kinase
VDNQQPDDDTIQMQAQLATVHTLYEISAAFLSQSNTKDVIFLLIRALADQVEGTIGTAFYARDEGERWRRLRVYASPGTQQPETWHGDDVWPGEDLMLELCYEDNHPFLVSEKHASVFAFWEEIAAFGAEQAIYYPLSLSERELIGVVALFLVGVPHLDQRDAALIRIILQQGAAALARTQLYEESRTNESRMRAILESSRDGVLMVGENETITYINQRAVDLLGLRLSPSIWEGVELAKLIDAFEYDVPDLAFCLRDLLYMNAPKQTASMTEEIQKTQIFETRQGHVLNLQYWPVFTRREESLGSLYLLRDVTEKRRLEQMQDDLFHMLVHDLRNPLSAIQNALQILRDPLMVDLNEEVVGIARANTDRMLDLVNGILEVGQLESGQVQLKQQPSHLRPMVEEVARDLIVSDRGVELVVDIPETMPPLWVDPLVFIRILQNLIGNALKFLPDTGGRIQITAAPSTQWATVVVHNNGPAIDADMVDRLFDKFVTGDGERRGYGLGLAFCRLAVEAHGGEIWAENDPDDGVSFNFTLPLYDDHRTSSPSG